MDSSHADTVLPCRVAPFGDLRIEAYVQLPAAYRSLSRPSSAPDAKASPLCSFQLDLSGSRFLRIMQTPSGLKFKIVGYPINFCSCFPLLPCLLITFDLLLIVQFSRCRLEGVPSKLNNVRPQSEESDLESLRALRARMSP